MKIRVAVGFLLLATFAAVAFQVRTAHIGSTAEPLTAYVPQDALLTIETPDFASLLHQWGNSDESKRWLTSANYSVFANSRLFGRLSDAQTSFATAAGIPAGTDLLNQVAGKQSVFAWYDIGKLEFLYITRMPADQASRSQLVQARSSFERRHAGNTDFYIRTSGAELGTVAFAQVTTSAGDLFILATREDLIANALTLIAASTPANSIRQEPWFRDASAALPAENPGPVLHMVLNLDRITLDPHFRSYWIQRNITWMHQFRAAASDLYFEPTRFREERVLLPKSPEVASSYDAGALAAIVPSSAGVFRSVATEDPSVAITAIEEKLLGNYTLTSDTDKAPDPDLNAPQDGSVADLETPIDVPPPVSSAASVDDLTHVFQSSGLDGVMTESSADVAGENGAEWIPIHSAVAVHAMSPVNAQVLEEAIQKALSGSLTTARIGIDFHSSELAGTTIYAMSGPRPLFFALSSTSEHGSLIFFADNLPMLREVLRLRSGLSRDSIPKDNVAPMQD
jgi:hypothetical protein